MVCFGGICIDNSTVLLLGLLLFRFFMNPILKFFGILKPAGESVVGKTVDSLPASGLTSALKEVKGKGTVFVDFYADWCGPCKRISPVFESLSKVHHPDDHFVKVDVQVDEAISSAFGITSLPTFLALRVNEENQIVILETVSGANRPALENMIKNHATSD